MNTRRCPMLRRSNLPQAPEPVFFAERDPFNGTWLAGVLDGPCRLTSGPTQADALRKAAAYFARNYRWGVLEGSWVRRER